MRVLSTAVVLSLLSIPGALEAVESTPATARAYTAAQTAPTQETSTDSLADATQRPALEPVDREQARTDEEIRAELQAVLDRIPEFAEIRVSVEAGVVRLEGAVLQREASEQASELARSFDGVRFVVDSVEEATSLEERLAPVWQRLREFGVGAVTKLPLLAVAFLIVLLAWLLGRMVRRIRLPRVLRTRNPFLQNLLQGLLQGIVILAGVLVALDLLDATALVGAIAGTAGLAGLAIGFAFKDIVENYLAGILLGLRQPFAKNDNVVVAGHQGKVVRLTWRDTILMTMDGNHVRIPNGQVFGSTVLNYTHNPRRRFQFDFGVGPADDLAGAQDLGVETLLGMRSILRDPGPRALAMDLGDSSVQVRFWAWVDQRQSDLSAVRSEAIRLVKIALESAGYSLPSPEYQVRIVGGSSTENLFEVAERPGPSVRSSHEKGERDTSVDHSVDEQIDEDRLASAEEDLLNEQREDEVGRSG